MNHHIDEQLSLIPGTELQCLQTHPDGYFKVGDIYKVCGYRTTEKYRGIRIRDSRRERKDFNFITASKNYVWKYFTRVQPNLGGDYCAKEEEQSKV